MTNFDTLTIAQLIETLRGGVNLTVTCKKPIEDNESYAEGGMRAVLVQGNLDNAEVAKITFDFSQFDEYNRQFEAANYFDDKGHATLTAREKGVYKEREVYYFTPSELASRYFEPVNQARLALLDEYTTSAETGQAYVSWLEQQVLAFRNSR
jgi:hypothetical protein